MGSFGTAKIKILSKEMIKPSVPTPDHLKSFKCSFLDQIAPIHYLPIILLYHSDSHGQAVNRSETVEHLKSSLSETLNQFYMLSGELRDDGFSISCDDGGVLFVDAEIESNVSNLVNKADYKLLNQCLPDHNSFIHDEGNRKVLVAVQFNVFSCGGIGIGLCFSHKAGDGYSAINFLKSWARRSKGCENSEDIPHPKFDSALYFPPTDVTKYKPVIHAPPEPNLIAKRFIFSQASINKIKETASIVSDLSALEPVTNSEVISAFILNRFMVRKKDPAAGDHSATSKRLLVSLYYVNLRHKMNPPLPEVSFGNFWRLALDPPSMLANENYDTLISKRRKAINGITSEEYIKNLRNGKDNRLDLFLLGVQRSPQSSNLDTFIFTSWLDDFPDMYQLDFGFGNPAYACSPSRPRRNMISLMNTKQGDGIEVWVNMMEDNMAKFESDPEIMSLITRQTC